MSILNKLSDVLKEVFWLKTSKKSSSKRTKRVSTKPSQRIIKKTKLTKSKKPASKATLQAKPVKAFKAVPKKLKETKVPKVPAVSKSKKNELDPNLVKVGEITHFFDRINVCVVKITQGTVLIGDKLTIAGPKTKYVQKVWSMQVESIDVKVAKKGQLIGLKVDKPVVVGDIVYK
jgi:translation initiation factor IF-2